MTRLPSQIVFSPLAVPALAAALLIALHLCGCGDRDAVSGEQISRQDGLSLSFYAIPECFLCEALRRELESLEDQYGRHLRFREYDYHLEMSQQGITRFQLGTHGIVIHDNQGNAHWTWKAHDESEANLRQVIERILTAAPAT